MTEGRHLQGIIMPAMSAPFLKPIAFLFAVIFEGVVHEPQQVELGRTCYPILTTNALVIL